MFGPKVHLFAAAIAFTFGGASAASAGLFDNNCCAPVAWGCQSTCGNVPNIIYGTVPQPTYYPRPVYPVDQGPVYDEPDSAPQESSDGYPYVAPYGGYGYPYYGPGYRRFGHGFRHFGVGGHRTFVHRFRQGFHTTMHPNRFVGHRTMTHTRFVHRGPMGHGRRR